MPTGRRSVRENKALCSAVWLKPMTASEGRPAVERREADKSAQSIPSSFYPNDDAKTRGVAREYKGRRVPGRQKKVAS